MRGKLRLVSERIREDSEDTKEDLEMLVDERFKKLEDLHTCKARSFRWDRLAIVFEGLALREEGKEVYSAALALVTDAKVWAYAQRDELERLGQRPESTRSWTTISGEPLTSTTTLAPSVEHGRTAEFFSGPCRHEGMDAVPFSCVIQHL